MAAESSRELLRRQVQALQAGVFEAVDMLCEKYNRVVLVRSRRDVLLEGTFRTYVAAGLLWAAVGVYVYYLGFSSAALPSWVFAAGFLAVLGAVVLYNQCLQPTDAPLNTWFVPVVCEWTAAAVGVAYMSCVLCSGGAPDDCATVGNPLSACCLLPLVAIVAANMFVPAVSLTIAVMLCMLLTVEGAMLRGMRRLEYARVNRLIGVVFVLSVVLNILETYENRYQMAVVMRGASSSNTLVMSLLGTLMVLLRNAAKAGRSVLDTQEGGMALQPGGTEEPGVEPGGTEEPGGTAPEDGQPREPGQPSEPREPEDGEPREEEPTEEPAPTVSLGVLRVLYGTIGVRLVVLLWHLWLQTNKIWRALDSRDWGSLRDQLLASDVLDASLRPDLDTVSWADVRSFGQLADDHKSFRFEQERPPPEGWCAPHRGHQGACASCGERSCVPWSRTLRAEMDEDQRRMYAMLYNAAERLDPRGREVAVALVMDQARHQAAAAAMGRLRTASRIGYVFGGEPDTRQAEAELAAEGYALDRRPDGTVHMLSTAALGVGAEEGIVGAVENVFVHRNVSVETTHEQTWVETLVGGVRLPLQVLESDGAAHERCLRKRAPEGADPAAQPGVPPATDDPAYRWVYRSVTAGGGLADLRVKGSLRHGFGVFAAAPGGRHLELVVAGRTLELPAGSSLDPREFEGGLTGERLRTGPVTADGRELRLTADGRVESAVTIQSGVEVGGDRFPLRGGRRLLWRGWDPR